MKQLTVSMFIIKVLHTLNLLGDKVSGHKVIR